jgi:glycosyltransferase involved in cell wall biosynthesis
MFLSVVAPLYNEEENIEKVLTYWDSLLESANYGSEIVVTNDGSTDKTPEILSKLQRQIKKLRVITHNQNYGYGRALSTAIHGSVGEWVVTIDSDGQFDLKDYKGLLDKAQSEKLDGVTGFRLIKKDTLIRVIADRVLNLIVRNMFKIKFTDTNCALKVLRGDWIRKINIEARGYPAPTEIIVKLSKLGAKLGEKGVQHIERQAGLSKLKPFQTGINFLRFLLYLRTKIKLYNKKIIHSL